MIKEELKARLFIAEMDNKRLEKQNDGLRRKLHATKYDEVKLEMKDFVSGGFYETEQVLKRFMKVTGEDLFFRVLDKITNEKAVA